MEAIKYFSKLFQEILNIEAENKMLREQLVEIGKKLNCSPAVPSEYITHAESGLGGVILNVLEDAPPINAHELAEVRKRKREEQQKKSEDTA